MTTELSLFSGAGGGLLATKHLLNWTTLGYVESAPYCQRVIAMRIRDGLLDEAPIFGDIRAFIDQGFAARYSGMVDVITGGDPCQDNSAAAPRGSQLNPSLGAEFIECVRIIRPRIVLRENPAVVRRDAPWSSSRFKVGLEALGYAVVPVRARACCFGSDHQRTRLFLLGALADADSEPDMEAAQAFLPKRAPARKARKNVDRGARRGESGPSRVLSEADVCGIFDEVADRVDRLKAIGNGWSPLCAAAVVRAVAGSEPEFIGADD